MTTLKQLVPAAFCLILTVTALSGCSRQNTGSERSSEESTEIRDISSQNASVATDESDPAVDGTDPAETLYQDILLTYGAELISDENGNGQIRVLKGISLYYSDDWNSVTELDNRTFYSWYLTMTWREDLTPEEREEKYASPFEDGMGWFFPQEYYEPLVQQYFDVSTEQLRSDSTYYHEEHQGYHVSGHAGLGATPFIITDHTEQDGELLRLYFTVHYEEEWEPDWHRVMTVRLRPDGGYYYESVQTVER